MVKITFDAENPNDFSWRNTYPEPEDFAAWIWNQKEASAAHTFDSLLEFAVFDRQAYDELIDIAATHKAIFTNAQKVRIFDVLMVSSKPRKGKEKTKYRDNKLRTIAHILRRDYGLPYSRNEVSDKKSAASVLAKLKGTPTERTIDAIISPAKIVP